MKKKIVILLFLAMLAGSKAECNDCIIEVAPVQNSICIGESATFNIMVSNAYEWPREISFSAAGDVPLYLDLPTSVVVGPYETKNIRAVFRPAEYVLGQHRLTITARSYGYEDSDDAIFEINDCYNSVLYVPEEFATCPEAGLTYWVTITNNGLKGDNYALSLTGTCRATLSNKSVYVEAGQSAGVGITLSRDIGECSLTFAAAGHDSVQGSTRVRVSRCYGVDLQILPSPEQSACRGEPVSYTLKVTNTGYYPDTYSLRLGGADFGANLSKKSMSLTAGSSDTASFNISGTWCATGDIPFTASVSGRASDTEKGVLRLLPLGESCSSLELVPAKSKTEIDCKGGVYLLRLNNNGYNIEEKVKLSVKGVKGVVQPGVIWGIRPTESRPAALYISPQDNKEFNLTIEATGAYGGAYLDLHADFTGPVCTVSELRVLPDPGPGDSGPANIIPFAPDKPVPASGSTAAGVWAGFAVILILIVIATSLLLLLLARRGKRGRRGNNLYFPEANVGIPSKAPVEARGKPDLDRIESMKKAIDESVRK